MSDQQPAVVVKDLYKSFKLPHERSNGVKQIITGFSKRKRGYKIQHVLDDVSFEIKKGEFFGIVGRNGSGKSTLLKLLAGIYVPDKGLIQVNGSLTPFIELGVGFNPELTGRENIFMNGALLGFSKKEMDDMYDDIVEFAELEDFMDQRLKNFSSGMQVRLAFSIAVRAKSDILLLDEVLAVGDSAFQKKCYDYFEKLKHDNTTIIIVTHDMSAVKRFCTRAIYIEDGKILEQGDPLDVADRYEEANIQVVKTDEFTIKEDNYLDAKIVSRENNKFLIEFKYKVCPGLGGYIGTSVVFAGISVAEITTSPDKPLTGEGKMTYMLDGDLLNGGVYQFTAALFNAENRELLTISDVKNIFTVKGKDITKGGALRLADTWKHE